MGNMHLDMYVQVCLINNMHLRASSAKHSVSMANLNTLHALISMY